MRFHQPLDQILDSAVKVCVLRFFCRKGGQWNGRRIAAELAINPVTAHAALRKLHQATLLDFHKVGNNFVYSLRDDHYLVREMLRPLFHKEAKVQERLLELLKEALSHWLQSDIVTIALYGSLARRKERPTSDIDLLILVTSEQAKGEISERLDFLWDTMMKEFGNSIAPYVNTVSEIQKKYQRRLPIIQNILAHCQVIWGVSLQEILCGRTTS